MRWKMTTLTIGLGGLLLIGGCSPATSSGNSATASSGKLTPNNAVVRVTLNEWQLKPSVASVPAGKVTFVAVDEGKEDHEVVLIKTDHGAKGLDVKAQTNRLDEEGIGENVGEVEAEAGVTEAGTFNLAPGHYVLVCNIPAHYGQGMYADLQVTGTTPAAPAVEAKKSTEGAAGGTTKAPAANAPASPTERKDVTLVKSVAPSLVTLVDAAQKGDRAAAIKAEHRYDILWHGIEVYASVRSPEMYAKLETDIQERLQTLLNDPQASNADIVSTAKELQAKFDELIKLTQDSPAISPLFEDLEALRMLKAETINEVGSALKANDTATAKSLLGQFRNQWGDIEDIVRERSQSAYGDIEGGMDKVNKAATKDKPDAAELTPLVSNLMARYNFAIALVNAAARNTDLKKTSYVAGDVQAAAALVGIKSELTASQTAWKGGKYQESADHAQRAGSTLFGKVSDTLKAKNGADAALKKALDAYTALADKAGDATTAANAAQAAFDAADVAVQVMVGQFWTDPKLQDAIRQAAISVQS